LNKAKLPTHIEIKSGNYGLVKDSVLLLEQIRTIDRKRLKDRIGRCDAAFMTRVNKALSISIALNEE
jgi:mRNA interferase MazF